MHAFVQVWRYRSLSLIGIACIWCSRSDWNAIIVYPAVIVGNVIVDITLSDSALIKTLLVIHLHHHVCFYHIVYRNSLLFVFAWKSTHIFSFPFPTYGQTFLVMNFVRSLNNRLKLCSNIILQILKHLLFALSNVGFKFSLI